MQDIIADFYGLETAPFRLTPDPRFFVGTTVHRKALNYLHFGLEQGEGFIVITGEIGAGKSLVIEHMLAQVDQSRIVASTLVTSAVEADEALKLVVSAFDLDVQERQKAAALEAFSDFLRREHSAGRRVLLIVDEAQNIPKKTIEEFRMLTNFQVEGQSVFQIFLVGQPQFRDILMDPDLEQLRQRVVASFHMVPLSFEDTQQYIEHRLGLVGWTGRPALTHEALRAIHRASGGLPRRINQICSRLLLFGALEELEELDETTVAAVLDDLGEELSQDQPGSDRARRAAAERDPAAGAPAPAGDEGARAANIERRVEALLQRYLSGGPAGGDQVRELTERLESVERSLSEIYRGKGAFAEKRDVSTLRGQLKELKTTLASLDERVTADEAALRQTLQSLIDFVDKAPLATPNQEILNGRDPDAHGPRAQGPDAIGTRESGRLGHDA